MAKRNITKLEFCWKVARRTFALVILGVPVIYAAHLFSAMSTRIDGESFRLWVAFWVVAAFGLAAVGTEEEHDESRF